MTIQPKDLIAALVLIGCFLLLGVYVIHSQVPPDVILLIIGPAIAGVLAYYFGAHNGNITGLAASASQLSSMTAQLAAQALEKRAPAPPAVVVQTAPGAAAPPSS